MDTLVPCSGVANLKNWGETFFLINYLNHDAMSLKYDFLWTYGFIWHNFHKN